MKQERTDYYYDYKDRRQANPPAGKGSGNKGRRRSDKDKPAPPGRPTQPARPAPPAARPATSPQLGAPARRNGDAMSLNLDEIDAFLRQQPPPPAR